MQAIAECCVISLFTVLWHCSAVVFLVIFNGPMPIWTVYERTYSWVLPWYYIKESNCSCQIQFPSILCTEITGLFIWKRSETRTKTWTVERMSSRRASLGVEHLLRYRPESRCSSRNSSISGSSSPRGSISRSEYSEGDDPVGSEPEEEIAPHSSSVCNSCTEENHIQHALSVQQARQRYVSVTNFPARNLTDSLISLLILFVMEGVTYTVAWDLSNHC